MTDAQHETEMSRSSWERDGIEINKPVTQQLLKSAHKWGTQSKKEHRGEKKPRANERNIKSSLAGTWMLFLPGDKASDEGTSLMDFLC